MIDLTQINNKEPVTDWNDWEELEEAEAGEKVLSEEQKKKISEALKPVVNTLSQTTENFSRKLKEWKEEIVSRYDTAEELYTSYEEYLTADLIKKEYAEFCAYVLEDQKKNAKENNKDTANYIAELEKNLKPNYEGCVDFFKNTQVQSYFIFYICSIKGWDKQPLYKIIEEKVAQVYPKPKFYLNPLLAKDNQLIANTRLINELATISDRRISTEMLQGRQVTFKRDNYELVVDDLTKTLGLIPVKLFLTAVMIFMEMNTAERKNYTIRFSLYDFAKLIDRNIEPNDSSAEEKKRAKSRKKDFKKDVMEAGSILRRSGVKFTEKRKGTIENFLDVGYLASFRIVGDMVECVILDSTAEGLKQVPKTYLPTPLMGESNPLTFSLGFKMAQHFYNTNNRLNDRQTFNRLKVSTLLKSSTIDLDKILTDDFRHWKRRIKEPLEKALDGLVKNGTIEKWKYCKAKGTPLTKADIKLADSNYDFFTDLNIEFNLKNAEDLTKTLEKAQANRIKQQERLQRIQDKEETLIAEKRANNK